MKLIEIHKKIQTLHKNIDIPYRVWTVFHEKKPDITIYEDGIQLGHQSDFVPLDQVKEALEWYVDQFGGKITWNKDTK